MCIRDRCQRNHVINPPQRNAAAGRPGLRANRHSHHHYRRTRHHDHRRTRRHNPAPQCRFTFRQNFRQTTSAGRADTRFVINIAKNSPGGGVFTVAASAKITGNRLAARTARFSSRSVTAETASQVLTPAVSSCKSQPDTMSVHLKLTGSTPRLDLNFSPIRAILGLARTRDLELVAIAAATDRLTLDPLDC